MQLLYSIGIYLYLAGIYIARPFLPKARAWVAGRKHWESHLHSAMAPAAASGRTVVWVHCASLGEFEQGRPLMEAIRQQHPSAFILLSFFSPSGYEVRKNYPLADAGPEGGAAGAPGMQAAEQAGSAASRHRLNRVRAQALAERWRPWRSVATWYLWRSLDPVPVEY